MDTTALPSRELTAELIRRYDRPGPRYTSYPTAVEFREEVGEELYARHLERAAAEPEKPLSLYFHLPFCAERCLYCGCNVVITKQRHVAVRYLDALRQEVREVARRLAERRRVSQLHWGGGTPTYLSPDEMRRLAATVSEEFDLETDAEVAVEVDPRATTTEHLRALRELGFNRLSVGVQDFTPEVQEAVHRVQSYEDTRERVETARELGFSSLNVDLIYGLPRQTPETFARTLEQVVALRPERIAVYSYAHMPWLKVQQRRIDESTLPAVDVKIGLIADAINTFRAAGYLAIGMDHFALADDELGRALEGGTLWRNFMGYSVRHAPDTVAFGMSSIGDVAGAYLQNERKLVRYERAVEAGRLPVERGIVLSDDDRLRRHVITALMCTFRVSFAEIETRFGVDFGRAFEAELEQLEALQEDGLVRLLPHRLEVVGLGRLFVRNVAMAFDAYLQRTAAEGPPRFSRTV